MSPQGAAKSHVLRPSTLHVNQRRVVLQPHFYNLTLLLPQLVKYLYICFHTRHLNPDSNINVPVNYSELQ